MQVDSPTACPPEIKISTITISRLNIGYDRWTAFTNLIFTEDAGEATRAPDPFQFYWHGKSMGSD